MAKETLYSIRMRASMGPDHISGAERISREDDIDDIVKILLARARSKRNIPDTITINIDSLQNYPVRYLTSLDVLTVYVPDVHAGRIAACGTLMSLGVSEKAVDRAITLLSRGASPSGKSMRGSIIMNAQSGERLEPDRERGVRASRFDYSDHVSDLLIERLTALGLTHHRTREALALATKVAHAPGVIAELCWSDDPDYTAGYVASLRTGYIRFPHLKEINDQKGGRVIFIDPDKLVLEELIEYLHDEPAIIDGVGIFKSAIEYKEYSKHLTWHS